MDTIFMNSEKSKTTDPLKLLLNLSDKINLKRSDIYVALSNLSIYYTLKNIKKSLKNIFKISAPTWNDKFVLPDLSFSVSIMQDYFEYVINKKEAMANNPPKLLQNYYKNWNQHLNEPLTGISIDLK